MPAQGGWYMEAPMDPTDINKRSSGKEGARPTSGMKRMAHGRLDNEGQDSTDSRNEPHFGEGEGEPLHKEGKKRVDKGGVEIAYEMDKGQ